MLSLLYASKAKQRNSRRHALIMLIESTKKTKLTELHNVGNHQKCPKMFQSLFSQIFDFEMRFSSDFQTL